MDAAWKAANSGAECAACHDGTFVNAADMIELTDARTAGHYGESTHTPTGMGGSVDASGWGGLRSARRVHRFHDVEGVAGNRGKGQGVVHQ